MLTCESCSLIYSVRLWQKRRRDVISAHSVISSEMVRAQT